MTFQIRVVLVRTAYPTNVGAAARAVANMGASQLILVDPQCEIAVEAREAAAGAQQPLKDMIHYRSWDDFYRAEGEGLRIAFTRRGGKKRKVTPLEETLAILPKEQLTQHPLYLIFGPEADGLIDDDLAFVNHSCELKTFGEFASLNLAQAVLLGLYETQRSLSTGNPTPTPTVTTENADNIQPFYFPDQLIREWLTTMGFDIHARKSSAYLTLKRLFLANHPTQHEIQVLESILQQNLRKLRK